MRHDLLLSFEESVFGVERDIEVSCFETCDICGGTGAKSSNCVKPCTECGGRGGVVETQRTPFGLVSQVSTCSKCGGDAKIITDRCRKCSGHGKVRSKRNVKVVVPPGVKHGASMQVQGEGNFDKKSGMAGDLYLVIQIEEKLGIWRDGLNLYSKVNLDYTEAILGTVKKVETVEGWRDLQIPGGVQPGDTVKLPSMGVPDMNRPSVRGDHRFIVNILIPKKISGAEQALVEKLASLRASCNDPSVPSEGTFQAEFVKSTINNRQKGPSSQGRKHVVKLWNSVKDFLRQRQSRKGFGSVSMEMSQLVWKSSRSESSYTHSIATFFIITCILTSIFKSGFRLFAKRTIHTCSYGRTKEHREILHS